MFPPHQVELAVSVPLRLSFSIGTVAIMSKGITDAIAQKDPTLALSSIQLQVQNADGSGHDLVTASVGLVGTISVSVIIAKAEASAGVIFALHVRLYSLNGNPTIGLDELFAMVDRYGAGALEYEGDITARVDFKVKVWLGVCGKGGKRGGGFLACSILPPTL